MSIKRSVNLCSIYVLPLLGLNRWSFGSPEKFVNSYLSQDNKYIVVECTQSFPLTVFQHSNFKFNFEKDNSYFAVFQAPQEFLEDLQKFKEGKYSTFSESAKSIIRKRSGLTYKVPIPHKGGYKSALELLALDKDKELKKYWETQLSNPNSPVILDDDAELASIPGDDNFYTLELVTELNQFIE